MPSFSSETIYHYLSVSGDIKVGSMTIPTGASCPIAPLLPGRANKSNHRAFPSFDAHVCPGGRYILSLIPSPHPTPPPQHMVQSVLQWNASIFEMDEALTTCIRGGGMGVCLGRVVGRNIDVLRRLN